MSYTSSVVVNNNQSANDADGSVTGIIPGAAGEIVIIGAVINNGTATINIGDNGDAGSGNTGSNPWIKKNSPDPDVVSLNTDVAWWAKKLTANDVGKTFTISTAVGGIREVAVGASFSGRSSVSDLIVQRSEQTSNSTTMSPTGINTPTDNYDIVGLFFTRAASATQISMTSPGGSQVKRAESATQFSASPNYAVTLTARDNAPAGSHGGNAATFNTTLSQVIVYIIGIKNAGNALPTCNAGADQVNVEPYSNVTLSGTDSDSDGTITARSWSVSPAGAATFISGQTSATAVAKVRGSLTGETITFTYQVTDNSGGQANDSMTVTTYPVTERAAVGGVWVDMEVRAL